jgi:hypothetical protein
MGSSSEIQVFLLESLIEHLFKLNSNLSKNQSFVSVLSFQSFHFNLTTMVWKKSERSFRIADALERARKEVG